MKEDIITNEERVIACDVKTAIKEFKENNRSVTIENNSIFGTVIYTDEDPAGLKYPEGWYYDTGLFTDRDNTETNLYTEILMLTKDGDLWVKIKEGGYRRERQIEKENIERDNCSKKK